MRQSPDSAADDNSAVIAVSQESSRLNGPRLLLPTPEALLTGHQRTTELVAIANSLDSYTRAELTDSTQREYLAKALADSAACAAEISVPNRERPDREDSYGNRPANPSGDPGNGY